MKQSNECPLCGLELCGVEYHYNHPEHYDGVSEWKCLKCHYRRGRWTGKELSNGEVEPRYGESK